MISFTAHLECEIAVIPADFKLPTDEGHKILLFTRLHVIRHRGGSNSSSKYGNYYKYSKIGRKSVNSVLSMFMELKVLIDDFNAKQ